MTGQTISKEELMDLLSPIDFMVGLYKIIGNDIGIKLVGIKWEEIESKLPLLKQKLVDEFESGQTAKTNISTIQEMIKIRKTNGYDTLHIDDIENIINTVKQS